MIDDDIQSVTTGTISSQVEEELVVQLPVGKPHPLKNKWTLWYDVPSAKRTTQQNWAANLKEVCTIESVEEFWAMYQHIPKPSEIIVGGNYYLFREGVKPMWEDPINAAGGKWTFNINPGPGNKLDNHWLMCLLGCISHSCDNEHAIISEQHGIRDVSHDICGVVLSIRQKQNRISIWNRNAANELSCVKIGEFFKTWCEFPSDTRGGYQPHASGDGKYAGGSKDKYTI